MLFGKSRGINPAWRDAAEFEALVRRHIGVVHAIALARLRDRDAAEDLAQEVFLRALLQFDPGAGTAAFGPWTVRVARNLATDWVRRGRTRSAVLPAGNLDAEEVANIVDESPSPRDRANQRQEGDALDSALRKLPDDLREAILLRYMEGLTKREIAERLELHPSTVGRQIDRALEMLKEHLGGVLEERLAASRPRPQRVARTVAMAAAVCALAPEAKAALLESAAMQQGAAAVAAAHASSTITAASVGAGGAATVGFAKIASVSVVVLAGAAIAGHMIAGRPSPVPMKAIPPRPAPIVTPIPATIPMQLAPLPPGWKVEAKPSGNGDRKFDDDGRNFHWTHMAITDAFQQWNAPARVVDPKLLAEMPYLDFRLEPPDTASWEERKTVMQTELQRAFGFRASLEKRMVRSIVLKAPNGVPPAFRVSKGTSGDVEFRNGSTEFTALPFDAFVRNIAIQRQMPAYDETGIQGRFDFTVPDDYALDEELEKLGFQVTYEDREADVLYAVSAR